VPLQPSTTHIQDNDLSQYVDETLDSARASYIRFHILKCTACKDRLIGEVVARLAALGKSQQSRRNWERALANSQASLQTLCPLSLERIAVEITNTSKNGYGIRTTIFLEPGTIVDLRIGATPAVATVRYCRNIGDRSYQGGIQLQTPISSNPVPGR
jgi:hypothetical protein